MSQVVDILETRVAAAVGLIAALRVKCASLERELSAARAEDRPVAAPADPAAEELERLRTERALVRERIRELIREIDQVPW